MHESLKVDQLQLKVDIYLKSKFNPFSLLFKPNYHKYFRAQEICLNFKNQINTTRFCPLVLRNDAYFKPVKVYNVQSVNGF